MPKYFVHLEDKSEGPMPESEVRDLIAAGRLEPEDWAMRETDDAWSTVGDLFPALATAAKANLPPVLKEPSPPDKPDQPAEPEESSPAPTPQTAIAASDATAAALQNQLVYDSQKKSVGLACLLNLIFPGVGYMYAGRVVLGLVVFFLLLPLAVLLGIFTLGLGFIVFLIVVIIDAYRTVERHNRKLAQSLLPKA